MVKTKTPGGAGIRKQQSIRRMSQCFAQVMYAEGLKNILDAILLVNRHRHSMSVKKREIFLREQALETLSSTTRVVAQAELLKVKRLVKLYDEGKKLLEQCNITPEEYQQKFEIISADCTRISHGSVHPPQWQ